MNLSDISKTTLKNKKIKRNRYMFAPYPEEIDDWDIEEARGHGVPHAIYYDTSNKISIFPSDIPKFSDLFSSENFGWCSSGWLNDDSQFSISEAEAVLKELCCYFNNRGIKAYLLYVYGSEKGYVNVGVNNQDDSEQGCDDMSLWIYTSDDSALDNS